MSDLSRLKTFAEKDGKTINAVIETPKGRRNKFKYEPDGQYFSLGGVLPAGAVFPFDFGFVPRTLGEDGDPLDVLVLMDEPAFSGCVVPSRLIGVIRARQTERDGQTNRNDRLIAVAEKSKELEGVRALSDLNPTLLREVEQFFVSFNRTRGKKFKIEDRLGPQAAINVIRRSLNAQKGKRKRK